MSRFSKHRRPKLRPAKIEQGSLSKDKGGSIKTKVGYYIPKKIYKIRPNEKLEIGGLND